MSDNLDIFEDVSNPLDSVEDIMAVHDWVFNRPHADELKVHVSGRQGQYSITFIWQEEYNAMQFFCEYDMTIPKKRQEMTSRVLHNINQGLWLGHIDVPEDTAIPCLRHTSLFRGWLHSSGAEHIEDLVEIALSECERYYNVFNMLSSSLFIDDAVLKLALMESAGEA